MDRQRDGRLGRVQLHPRPLFQHRPEILRAIRADANADTYGHGNSDCDSNSYADHHTDRYTKGKSDAED
jgi:hypothetical protein